MSVFRFVARILVVAVTCVAGTFLFGWPSLVAIGLLYGLLDRSARARGSTAALGGALSWLAILVTNGIRGDDVPLVAERMGAVLQAPAWAFVVLTLCFSAVLCGCAAAVGSAISRPFTRNERGRRTASA